MLADPLTKGLSLKYFMSILLIWVSLLMITWFSRVIFVYFICFMSNIVLFNFLQNKIWWFTLCCLQCWYCKFWVDLNKDFKVGSVGNRQAWDQISCDFHVTHSKLDLCHWVYPYGNHHSSVVNLMWVKVAVISLLVYEMD